MEIFSEIVDRGRRHDITIIIIEAEALHYRTNCAVRSSAAYDSDALLLAYKRTTAADRAAFQNHIDEKIIIKFS